MPARPVAMAPAPLSMAMSEVTASSCSQAAPPIAGAGGSCANSVPSGVPNLTTSFPFGVGMPQYYTPPVSFQPCSAPASAAPSSQVTGSNRGNLSSRSGTCASRHMAAEQRRRARINERLDALRTLVPHTARANTAAFLTEVHDYIITLHRQLDKCNGGVSRESIDLNSTSGEAKAKVGSRKVAKQSNSESNDEDIEDADADHEGAKTEEGSGSKSRKRERASSKSDDEESEVEWEDGDGHSAPALSASKGLDAEEKAKGVSAPSLFEPVVKKPHAHPHPSLVLGDASAGGVHPSLSCVLQTGFSDRFVKPSIGESNGRSAFSPPTPPQSTSPNHLALDAQWSGAPALPGVAPEPTSQLPKSRPSSPPSRVFPRCSSPLPLMAPPIAPSLPRPQEVIPSPASPIPSLPMNLGAPAPSSLSTIAMPLSMLSPSMYPLAAAAVDAAQQWGMAVAQAQAHAHQVHVQAFVNAQAAAHGSRLQVPLPRPSAPAPAAPVAIPAAQNSKRRRKIASAAEMRRSHSLVVRPIAIKPQV